MKKVYKTKSVKETQEIAQQLAKKILKNLPAGRQGIVIGLQGELGGGKTTFVQGFAKGLGIKEKILSPTFVIFKRFPIKERNLYHFDCYRVKNEEDILELGFEEIISNPKNIVVIEWASKIKKIMPKDTIWINFKFVNETTRVIDFT